MVRIYAEALDRLRVRLNMYLVTGREHVLNVGSYIHIAYLLQLSITDI